MSRRPAILGQRRWIGLLVLVGLALGQAVAMVVTAFAIRDVFMFLRDGGSHLPVVPLIAIGLCGAILFGLRAFEGRVAERTGQGYAADIRKALFEHVTLMPTSAIARRRSGALALRYVGDLTAFKGWVSRGLARLISASITIPAAFLVLYLVEPKLFWGAVFPIGAVMAGIFWLGRPLGEAHSELRARRARLAAVMSERLPQGIALRRSGRMKTELRLLGRKSDGVVEAAVRRASLAATVRALPDAGSGIASAVCLYICMRLGLGVPDAVTALTATALVIWPLRHLADVSDRRRAYVVASGKLDALMSAPQLTAEEPLEPPKGAPALSIVNASLPGFQPFSLRVEQGEMHRLVGPDDQFNSTLLLMLAGFEAAPSAIRFDVLGLKPVNAPTGHLLYLGRYTPQLKGSLRRETTLGIGRTPSDAEILDAIDRAGLNEMAERIGGLTGIVAEGRRNLTADEKARLYLVRGLLARPKLALIDAGEIGLSPNVLSLLLAHFRQIGTAVLIAKPEHVLTEQSKPVALLRSENDTPAVRDRAFAG